MTSSEPRLLLAVDAPSLLHRAYHAHGIAGLRDRGGRPAWALHGMLRQLLETIEAFSPDAVVLGLDDRASSVRAAAYPAYKAGRAAKDDALVEQLERCGPLLDALGLLTVTPSGLEADDVSASASTWAARSGWRCVIVTSDRDAFAHIGPTTEVLRLISGGGVQGSPLLNPTRFRALYDIDAADYLAFAALRGDASDNLPGVTGVGEKTASLLLSRVGTMREIWADIDHAGGATLVAALDAHCEEHGKRRIGERVRRSLTAPGAREQFESNLKLMAGRCDIDLGLQPDLPGSPGLLPRSAEAVRQVVDHLGVAETTRFAVRVLSGETG
ncbi:MAG: 5'-3' exonuclease H3TH domain-containing protein [Nocardioides sp.]